MEKEKVYTIPLRDARKAAKRNRAARAVKLVKKYIEKHMDPREVKIDSDLNEKIWNNSAQKPPSKVRVRAARFGDGTVEVSALE